MAPALPGYSKLSGNDVYQIPPSPPSDHHKPRTSLFDMISHDQIEQQQQQQHDQTEQQQQHRGMIIPHFPMIQQPPHFLHPQQQQGIVVPLRPLANFQAPPGPPPPQSLQHSSSLQDRIHELLQCGFNDASTADLRVTLVCREQQLSVTANVHSRVLASCSRCLAPKIDGLRPTKSTPPTIEIEVPDCNDVEFYLLAIKLMYASDIKRELARESVMRAIGILKVAATIVYEAGILSCLEYLEAIPWTNDEEGKVVGVVSQLRHDFPTAAHAVLKRVAAPSPGDIECASTSLLLRIIRSVLDATSDRARRDMKPLVSRLLRDNVNAHVVDVSKESLYAVCRGCLDGLVNAAAAIATYSEPSPPLAKLAELSRHVDGVQWLTDILLDRHLAADLVEIWGRQSRLARLHHQMSVVQRYEISRVSAKIFVAIGRGHVISTLEARSALTSTWLEPLMDDFAWLHRTAGVAVTSSVLSRGANVGVLLDRRSIEEGVSATILTLAADEQRNILMAWFDRFARDGEDCPNLQQAFEVWWRRSFLPIQNQQLLPP